MEPSPYDLTPQERRTLIEEIQISSFHHLDVDQVRWVTSWALTLAGLRDETILNIWEHSHGRR